jgi:DUF971 family protein
MAGEVRPASLKREGDGLKIEWSDGVTTFATWLHLRKNCPCASCLEERAKPPDPFRVLTPQETAAGAPQPVAMRPVGHYAYQITWNDGHDTGIYTLETLRNLSEQNPGSQRETP